MEGWTDGQKNGMTWSLLERLTAAQNKVEIFIHTKISFFIPFIIESTGSQRF